GYKPSDAGHAPYSASKFGLIGLSKSTAIDYGQQGIRVNVVCPGFTHSEMVDPLADSMPDLMGAFLNRYSAQKRLGDAEEVAEAIAWLCSDASRFVSGAVLAVDGGGTSRMY
ncbi:MAG: SDR family oxidoreductase, partial [Acidobacteriota bacterium]